MELSLAGKRAFISGSTQGIGRAIARALLEEGATVVVNGRGDERLQTTVDGLRAQVPGADVSGIAADFTDAAQVQDLAERLGPVDVLVNNVGVFEVKAFDQIPDDDWQRYFEVNVMSGVRMARHALPGMLERGWGRIIFVGSESGVNVPSDMTHYGMSKAASLAVANGLAKLTRGTAVTVNTILGGPTYSDGVDEAVRTIAMSQGMAPDDLKGAIATGHPTSLLQRFIEPEEIASLAVYLASPVASAVNGAALRADGGALTGVL